MTTATSNLVNLIDEIKDKINDDEYLKLMDCALLASKHVVKEADLISARDNCRQCTALGMICECSVHEIFNNLLTENELVPDLYRIIVNLNLEKYRNRLP